MRYPRRHMFRLPRIVCRAWSHGLIASLLFMQLAMAAHACPQAQSTPAASAAMPCAQTKADAAPADDAQPGLCHEHCKGGTQTVDSGQAPGVSAPLLLALFTIDVVSVPGHESSAWIAVQQRRDRAPPLALSVVYCCYRL